ncbi:hypothetical protein BU251_01975 [Candidatus Velamenicoccus archaeovorus]|uniref:HTH cro/C1-type domain-containing protein n=1 Tax=Velamenicoccus archaeovorus TaxID=1930593 RepID=A0A410P3A8_VELA1|nr:hypothetical protein BU251_01975 [Candidatus Velamenicoccus archaeovorus]
MTPAAMQNPELIRKMRLLKAQKEYTLYDLSRILDVQVATIERWFRTGRINKIYARLVQEKLSL